MGIWKDRKQKDWKFRFEYRGRNYTGRGFKTRREAATAREKKREEVRQEERKQDQNIMGFREMASLYLDFCERRFASSTYQYKKLVYKAFLDFHKDLPVTGITPQAVHDYLDTRPSNHNYNAHRKELAALFNFARNRLKLDIPNPCRDLDKMPHSPRLKRIPSQDEIVKLILAADPETDEQDLLIVLIHTLGRIDEVLRLTWQDVNFDKRTVTLWTRKRKDGAYEPDVQPMNEALHEVLWKKWKERKQDKWVFYNEDTRDRFYHRPRMMASLCRRAGIPPIGAGKRKNRKKKVVDVPLYYGFHSIRHFMASYLADSAKVSLSAISKLLRHKEKRTTEIYLHSIDESARAAMSQVEEAFTPKSANLTSKNQDPHLKTAPIKGKGATDDP